MNHASTLNSVPMVVSQVHLTYLLLNAIKVDLIESFAGAMIRYQISRPVAEIILSMTNEEIQMLAEQSSRQNIIRVCNGQSMHFWSDLKQALATKDKTAVGLSLIQSLLTGVPSATNTASAIA